MMPLRNDPHEATARNIHIQRIASMLEGKLTSKDTPVLLKEVASSVVDLYDDVNEIHRAVRGYNGDAGMLTMLTRIQTHLGITNDGKITPEEKDDRFDKFLKWLGDKVAPQVVTVIVLAVLYLAFGK